MKMLRDLSIAAAVAALLGCASRPHEECSFPEGAGRAPSWVCAPYAVEGFKDTGYGTYPKSGAGYQFSLDQAAAKARAMLATQVKTRLTEAVRAFASANGVGASEAVQAAASTATVQITEATLLGAKLARSTTDSKGAVHVVVGMDVERSTRLLQEALNAGMQSQPAVWRQVGGNRSPAEMQAEILKMGSR